MQDPDFVLTGYPLDLLFWDNWSVTDTLAHSCEYTKMPCPLRLVSELVLTWDMQKTLNGPRVTSELKKNYVNYFFFS